MKTFKIYNYIFYFCYAMLLVNSTCTNVRFLSSVIYFNQLLIPVLLIIMMLTQSKSYYKKSLFLIAIILSINILTLYITKETSLFLTFLMIICAKNIDAKTFIKRDFIFKLIIIIFVISCYKLGYADNNIMYRDDGLIRNSLGFTHPNRLGLLLFSMCCDLIYIHNKNYKLIDYLFLLFSLIICSVVCDSRSSQIGIIAILIEILYLKMRDRNKSIPKGIILLPVMFAIITFLLTFLYSKNISIMYDINKLISNRLLYCLKFFQYYGITLFGNVFEFYGMWGISNRLSVLDNAYMHILIHYGILNFILIISLFTKLIKNSITNKKIEIIIYIIPFLAYGLMEHHIFEIQFNSILICMSELLFMSYGKNIKQQ